MYSTVCYMSFVFYETDTERISRHSFKGQKLNVLTVLRMEIRNKLLIAVRNLS